MAERIWDESVLDTTKGDFEVTNPVPDRYNLPLNPDGTKPQMTAKVTAPTLRMALSAAKALQEDEDIIVEALLSSALSRAEEGDVVPDTEDFALLREALHNDDLDTESDEPAMEQFLKFVQEYTGWEHNDLELTISVDGKDQEVVFALHTPGYATANSFLQYVVSDKVLNSIMANAMPLAYDEDEDGIYLYDEEDWDDDDDWDDED